MDSISSDVMNCKSKRPGNNAHSNRTPIEQWTAPASIVSPCLCCTVPASIRPFWNAALRRSNEAASTERANLSPPPSQFNQLLRQNFLMTPHFSSPLPPIPSKKWRFFDPPMHSIFQVASLPPWRWWILDRSLGAVTSFRCEPIGYRLAQLMHDSRPTNQTRVR